MDSDDSSDDQAALVADAMLDQIEESNMLERNNEYHHEFECSKVDMSPALLSLMVGVRDAYLRKVEILNLDAYDVLMKDIRKNLEDGIILPLSMDPNADPNEDFITRAVA